MAVLASVTKQAHSLPFPVYEIGPEVRIPLNHLDVFIAEDFCQRIEIPAFHHEVTGERVAQVVKAEIK